jgi:1-acyl-sn-glycerol-3-phosphate acyltransferase
MPLDSAANDAMKFRPLGVYGVLSRIAHALMRRWGWVIEVIDPLPKKCVLIVYPHTSNWDFPVGLLTKWAAGLTVKGDGLRYAGKTALFVWPWGWFFRAVGGFPVNRSGNTGFTEQMAAKFQSESQLIFVIAPEGTRSYRDHVRSSFYYVAKAASVPILLGTFDFARKKVIITELFSPTEDVASDLARIARYYAAITPPEGLGHTPTNAAPWIFKK